MNQRLILIVTALIALLMIAGCSSPTPAPTGAPVVATATAAPTSVPTATQVPTVRPTLAPTATAMPTGDNCVTCHTNKDTLEKLATKTTVKSAATQGEG
ncbi:MAG: hypothetical protein KGJ80_03090 [Chloroflexota bacterium]|nr:hypothetical protein [Chloroflexota bacterium]